MATFGLDGGILFDPASGYSVPLVGQPEFIAVPDGDIRYDAVVRLGEVPIEHGFRIDEFPSSVEPGSLAVALALAYGKNRSGTQPTVRDIPDLPTGAVAGARTQYRLRGSELDIERVWIAVKPSATGTTVLYFTSRANLDEVNPICWAHVLSTMNGQHRWGVGALREPIWPPSSSIAPPTAYLDLTMPARDEAVAKARDLNGHALADNVIGLLSRFAQGDDPPAKRLVPGQLVTVRTQVRERHAPDTAEILLRNLDQCTTWLDFRGWAWQCVWAIGNV